MIVYRKKSTLITALLLILDLIHVDWILRVDCELMALCRGTQEGGGRGGDDSGNSAAGDSWCRGLY